MNGEQTPFKAAKFILVSACLLGLPTRYDGEAKPSKKVFDYLMQQGLRPIPVCPEQLAGMPTPRSKTFFQTGDGNAVITGNGRVVSSGGSEMNDVFLRGARMVLTIAQLCNCKQALLKERSPSCGVHQIYLEENRIDGSGVTTAMLVQEGISVISEEDL